MKYLSLIIVGAFSVTVLAASETASAATAGSTVSCLGPDASSAVNIDYLQFLVTDTDTATVATRQMWALPSTTASNVTLVTDTRICTNAADAFSADLDPTNPMQGRRVYVVKVSNVYVVWDPNVKAGEFGVFRTLDRQYQIIARVAG